MAFLSRNQLRSMAEEKAADADLLYQHRRFSNAYYLFGYSVELGLKACIARQFLADALPDKQLVTKIFTHKLGELVGLAGLRLSLESERSENLVFDRNWAVVSEWSEEARYEIVNGESCAKLRFAIMHEHHGVKRWLSSYW